MARLPAGEASYGYLTTLAYKLDAHGYPDLARHYHQRTLDWFEGGSPEALQTSRNRASRARRLVYLERNEEARALLLELMEEAPNLGRVGRLGIVEARLGNRTGAERASERLRTWEDDLLRGANKWWRARIAAAQGDLDGAVRLLEQSFGEGALIRDSPRHDPLLKPLRGYPPFEELIRPKG